MLSISEHAQPAVAPAVPKRGDLEIKDAQIIFSSIWRELETEFGHENLRFPKEFILLGGAPGAGKGTNTAFISKVRGLTCQPVVISSLLKSPETQKLKDAGNMVGDRDVIGLVLRALLRPEYQDGVILDGFPRTNVQVECLKLLVDKMHALRREFYTTHLSIHFRQPTIHIMVLFVDEKESVARQLKRGRETKAIMELASRPPDAPLPEDRPESNVHYAARTVSGRQAFRVDTPAHFPIGKGDHRRACSALPNAPLLPHRRHCDRSPKSPPDSAP